MGIPPNIRHLVYVSLFVAMAGLQALGKLEPTWTWITMAVQFATILATVFTDAPGTAAKMAAIKMASRVTGLLALVLTFGLSTLTACAPGTNVPPVIVTDATCLAGWITVDLENGMALPAALADAATRCLGSASAENVARAQAEYEKATAALRK